MLSYNRKYDAFRMRQTIIQNCALFSQPVRSTEMDQILQYTIKNLLTLKTILKKTVAMFLPFSNYLFEFYWLLSLELFLSN